jgi:hypothetical protein
MPSLYRSPSRKDVTADIVRFLFDYDPITGILRWKNPTRKGIYIGDVAGTMQRGRRIIYFYRNRFEASNIAWLHFHGEWPKLEIDHRNRDPFDNSIANLRDVPTSTNQHNQGKNKKNTSGFKGVHKHPQQKGWWAKIGVDGIRYDLGLYPTAELAAGAYRIAAAALHWEA